MTNDGLRYLVERISHKTANDSKNVTLQLKTSLSTMSEKFVPSVQ